MMMMKSTQTKIVANLFFYKKIITIQSEDILRNSFTPQKLNVTSTVTSPSNQKKLCPTQNSRSMKYSKGLALHLPAPNNERTVASARTVIKNVSGIGKE